jgi:hypothetical protein
MEEFCCYIYLQYKMDTRQTVEIIQQYYSYKLYAQIYFIFLCQGY